MIGKMKFCQNALLIKKTVVISSGTCGQASGSIQIIDAFKKELKKRKLGKTIGVEITGCHGFCEMEPNIIIFPDEIFYCTIPKAARFKRPLLKNNRVENLTLDM